MLPVREMPGRANCLARREAATAALKCLCLASVLPPGHIQCLCWVNSKSQRMRFYLQMTCSGCPLSVSEHPGFHYRSSKLCSYIMFCPHWICDVLPLPSSIMLEDPVEAHSVTPIPCYTDRGWSSHTSCAKLRDGDRQRQQNQ